MQYIKKRDGEVVPFNKARIREAIERAAHAADEFDEITAIELAEVAAMYIEREVGINIPTVDMVQDVIEKVLIETGKTAVAREFIAYRSARDRLRVMEQMDLFQKDTSFTSKNGLSISWDREGLSRYISQKAKIPDTFALHLVKLIETYIFEK